MQQTIQQAVQQAIRPQLRQLKRLEQHHERKAQIERLKRRYDMHDATEQQIELHAAKQAFKHVGEVAGNAFKQVTEAAQLAVQGFASAFNGLQNSANAAPVPAEQHAGFTHDTDD